MTDRDMPPAWLPNIRKPDGPIYLAIAAALEADIRSGALRPGDRLPTQRRLAAAIGIDFTTVTRAYAEAARRGLIEGRVGLGTYVRIIPPPRAAATAGGLIDMSMNLPPCFDDPALAARLWRDVTALGAESGLDLLLRYQDIGGAMADRAAGAHWLRDRMGPLPPERVLLCPGAQGALLAIAGLLAAPGDAVCVEDLTYPGFRALAAHRGLRLVPVAMDADGLLPDAFEAACRAHRPKLLYCTPTLHNPTTATMPPDRRAAIAAIATAQGIAIVEDDAYGMLPRSAPPPLATFAPSLSYYIAGVAKSLSPALRLAYVVPPDAAAAHRLAAAIRATTSMASPLTAAIATRWIGDGTAEAVREAIRRETASRRQILRALLPEAGLRTAEDAFHAWLPLDPPWTRSAFIDRLRSAGIGAVGSDAFAAGTAPEAVRLGLGAPATREALRTSLEAVAAALAAPPPLADIIV